MVLAALVWSGCNLGWLDVDGEGEGRSGRPTAGGDSERGGDGVDFETRTRVGIGGLKRLTRHEYDNTLQQLFGGAIGTRVRYGEKYLPDPVAEPFANNFLRQSPSGHLVENVRKSAESIVDRAVEELEGSEAMQRHVFGCTPEGPEDAECFRSFLEQFGRRALRRPLRDSELETYMNHFFRLEPLENSDDAAVAEAVSEADFFLKTRLALEALLQHSEFLYRPELGEPAPNRDEDGVVKLGSRSMASRLSYVLWGGPPDDRLLKAVSQGNLETREQVRRQAERMLEDPRARERIYQFHAAWLGFQDFWLRRIVWDIPSEVSVSMREETRRLLERVIFEERADWRNIFMADKTFVDRTLANWYGFVDAEDVEEGGSWVQYPEESPRGGILSHASFLTNGRGQKGKTKMIRRAALLFDRVTCNGIEPAANMDPPESAEEPETDCKFDWFESKTLAGSCKNCHYRLNYVGVGLENFDNAGRYRSREPETEDDCEIPSERAAFYAAGEDGWQPTHEFDGPGELGEIVIREKGAARCMVSHLYEFALGHPKQPRDREAIDRLYEVFKESDYRFDELVLALVTSDAFRYRVKRDASSGESAAGAEE
jgi:hypothetical protein